MAAILTLKCPMNPCFRRDSRGTLTRQKRASSRAVLRQCQLCPRNAENSLFLTHLHPEEKFSHRPFRRALMGRPQDEGKISPQRMRNTPIISPPARGGIKFNVSPAYGELVGAHARARRFFSIVRRRHPGLGVSVMPGSRAACFLRLPRSPWPPRPRAKARKT